MKPLFRRVRLFVSHIVTLLRIFFECGFAKPTKNNPIYSVINQQFTPGFRSKNTFFCSDDFICADTSVASLQFRFSGRKHCAPSIVPIDRPENYRCADSPIKHHL